MTESSNQNQKSKAQLRDCKLCGKEISPLSAFCKSCGHPQGATLALWLMGAFLFFLIVFYIAMTLFCMCNVQKFRSYSEPHPNTKEQSEQIQPSVND